MKKYKILIIVTFFLVATFFVSSTNWYLLNDNTQIGLDKIQDCYTKVDIEHSYTCETDYFNYTTNPNFAECWNYSESNESYSLVFAGSFLYGNIPSKTIYWNETIQDAYCVYNKQVNIYLNKSDKVFHWICDYSNFGECKIDKTNKRLVCDSSRDGNKDGVCDSGESCFILNVTKEGLHKIKSNGFSSIMEQYDIECEIQ